MSTGPTRILLADDHAMVRRGLRMVLDELGLGTALCNLARRMAGAAELDLRLSVPERLPPLPEDVELVIYRIAQEALTNVVRHAGASFAAMSVRVEAGRLRLAVYDDGCGLPVEHRDGAGIRGVCASARSPPAPSWSCAPDSSRAHRWS